MSSRAGVFRTASILPVWCAFFAMLACGPESDEAKTPRERAELSLLGICDRLADCIDEQTDSESVSECRENTTAELAGLPERCISDIAATFECALRELPRNYCELDRPDEEWHESEEVAECDEYVEATEECLDEG